MRACSRPRSGRGLQVVTDGFVWKVILVECASLAKAEVCALAMRDDEEYKFQRIGFLIDG